MSQLTDFRHDTYQRQLAIMLQTFDIPDEIKTASLPDDETLRTGSRGFFAEPVSRTFPCHTKAATALSYLFYLPQANKLPKTTRNAINGQFDKLGKYWGINGLMAQWKNQHETKQAQIELSQAGGTPTNPYPLHSSDDVRLSAHNLCHAQDRYPLTILERVDAAQKILKRACELDMTLPAELDEPVTKLASGIICSAERLRQAAFDLRRQLEPRQYYAYSRDIVKQAIQACAAVDEFLFVRGNDGPEYVLKAAETLEQVMDAICHRFGPQSIRRLPLDQILFDAPVNETKLASIQKQLVTLTNGNAFAIADLTAAGLAPYSAADDQLADAVAAEQLGSVDPVKLATILPTLPRTDADRLTEWLKRAGVRPIGDQLQPNTAYTEDDLAQLIEPTL